VSVGNEQQAEVRRILGRRKGAGRGGARDLEVGRSGAHDPEVGGAGREPDRGLGLLLCI